MIIRFPCCLPCPDVLFPLPAYFRNHRNQCLHPFREKAFFHPAPLPEIPEEPVIEEISEEPVKEAVDPKAAIYGKAVEDIRQAISLGDRFLYQRELFGQNAELMQRTLTELNALSSFDEAIAYISAHFQWDTESSTYQQFLVTLHRRFG